MTHRGRNQQSQLNVNKKKFFLLFKGSGVIKAGFAGDQVPKYHFPNL